MSKESMIYKVADEYIAAFEYLKEVPDISDECVRDTLSVLSGDLVKNTASFIKNIEHEIKGLKEYENTIKERRKKKEELQQKIEEYLISNMLEHGISEIESTEIKLRLKDNPASVELNCVPTDLPAEFVKTEIIHKAKLIELRKALQNGQEIAGVRLVRKKRLDIL
jgi:hypothetical protein